MIKRLIAVLCAIALLSSQAWSYSIFLGDGQWEIAILGCGEDTTDATTHTSLIVPPNVGAPTHRDALFVVGVIGEDNATSFSISALTYTPTGQSAVTLTEHVDSSTVSTTSLVVTGFYSGIVRNGADNGGNFSLTWSEAVTGAALCFWVITNGTSFANGTSQFQTSSAAITISTNVTTQQFAFGICTADTAGQTTTWTGLTERSDGTGTEFTVTTGSATGVSGTPLAITCDMTGTGDSIGSSMVLNSQ